MITVSDDLYASYQERDFYNFLFDFLSDHSRHGGFQAALRERERARALWQPYFDPQARRMELALRHAYVLARELLGEPLDGAIPEDVTPMHMKALLDINGLVPFSTFDRRDD